MCKPRKLAGFTLIEILVVVALIAILTAITFIAINPAKNFQDTRNTQRSSDVSQILNAVTQYTSEQGHALSGLGTIPTCTADPADMASIGTAGVDLAAELVDTYIVGIPVDPQLTGGGMGTAAATGYTMCSTTGGRVTVNAPNVEGGKTIMVKR
jgi:prepilin-type N-terminal cleavage/methylation domain-containing protein